MSPAEHWAAALASWAIPEAILAQAPESPWFHDPAAFAADETVARDSVSALRARSALGGSGSVIDVGCGGGRSSLALVPEVNQIVGVDASEAMLASFREAAARYGVSATSVHGRWPDVADRVGDADVVVCHHVLYNVAEIGPFLSALTGHARRLVVVELTTVHPQSVFNDAWRHFWGIERPTSPTSDDAAGVARSLGCDVRVEQGPLPPMARAAADVSRQVPSLRRRLCLPSDRDGEVATWLADHPIDAGARQVVTLSWTP